MKSRNFPPSPILWALFGAGGMLSALTGPVLVFIVGIAVPLGFLLPADTLSFVHLQIVLHSLIGKLILLAIIVLYLWHAAHRIFKSLHDVGIPPGTVAKLACYGSALVGTLITIYCLTTIR